MKNNKKQSKPWNGQQKREITEQKQEQTWHKKTTATCSCAMGSGKKCHCK